MRWIWIDRFTEFTSGKTATAIKNLSLAEDPFAEHFPGWPVMPAPLMIEGVAQTGGILVGEAGQFQEKVVLAKIPSAKFYREVFAGESLKYSVEITTYRQEGASIRGRILVGDELIGEVEMFFAHLDQSRSRQIFGDHNFVFSGDLKFLIGQAVSASATGGEPPVEPDSTMAAKQDIADRLTSRTIFSLQDTLTWLRRYVGR